MLIVSSYRNSSILQTSNGAKLKKVIFKKIFENYAE